MNFSPCLTKKMISSLKCKNHHSWLFSQEGTTLAQRQRRQECAIFYHLLSSSALQCFLPLPSQKQFLCDPNTQNFCCPNFYMFKFKQGHVKCSVFASCFAERCILRVPILGGFNMPFGSSKADRENECENDHRPVREAERSFRGTE